MADFSEITINTTAQKIERMANMEINNETIDDTSDDNSLPTSKLVYDFVSNSASGVNGDFVSYSQPQDLTDEQKETARNNINAVDASLVVSSISDDSQIPNGAGVRDAINEITLHNCVRCDVEQPLIDAFKQIARENINAVDASLVVDNLVDDKQLLVDHIPNGQALQSFIEANAVSSAVYTSISENKKLIARTNIGAVSQTDFDETVGNINSILATVVSGGVS